MLTDDFFHGTKLHHNKLMELCKPISKYLGITQAGYVYVDQHGGMYLINSNVEMMEDHLAQEGYKNATFIVNPNNMHSGFAFDNACTDEKYKNINLYNYATKFGWHNSFIYAEKDNKGGYFAINFATTKENFGIVNRVVNEAKIIKKLVRDLQNKITKTFYNDIHENKMNFALLRGDSFYTARGRVFNEHFEKEQQNKIKLLKDSGIINEQNSKDLLGKIHLSPQELNCLRIYHATHSVKKVAKDLNLGATTVTSYIENIKAKFNCNNKNELFEKAEILELLGYIYL